MRESGARLQTFSTRSAARILAVPPERIRYWVKRRLVEPARKHGRRYEFGFNDLLILRLAKELLPTHRHLQPIRRCFERLGELLDPARPLTALKLYEEDGRIVVRDGRMKFEADSGQLILDFDLERFAREVDKSSGAKRRATLNSAAEVARAQPLRAIRLYNELLAREPRNATAHVGLARLLDRHGDTDGALRHLLTAATIEPANAEAHYRLGLSHLKRGQSEDALKSFVRVIELDPGRIGAHRRLAELYEAMGRKRDAIRHLGAIHRLTRDS